MSKFKEMFYYGNFKKRIIITIVEYILASIIWILVDQSITYSLFDGAIAKENIGLIIFLSIVMFVKVVSQIIEGIIQCKLRHHLQRDFSNYARKNIFNKIIKSKINFFDKSNSSELFELIMNDSDNLAKFFSQNGNQLVGFTIRALTYIIILLFINVKLTLILILIYFIGYASLIISNRKTIFLLKEIRNLNVSITKWITEQINGFENIKALKIEKNRLKKMETLIEKYSKECCRLDKIIRKYVFVYNFFSLLTTLVVVYIGGLDILSGVF